jgi:hypothetical protein
MYDNSPQSSSWRLYEERNIGPSRHQMDHTDAVSAQNNTSASTSEPHQEDPILHGQESVTPSLQGASSEHNPGRDMDNTCSIRMSFEEQNPILPLFEEQTHALGSGSGRNFDNSTHPTQPMAENEPDEDHDFLADLNCEWPPDYVREVIYPQPQQLLEDFADQWQDEVFR